MYAYVYYFFITDAKDFIIYLTILKWRVEYQDSQVD